jgi:hypothetical protein
MKEIANPWNPQRAAMGVDSVTGSGGLRIWRGSRVAINESC